MKLLIASDIHGDIAAARAVFCAREREGCERVLLLGDLLYHGPRNDLPAAYAPKEVIALLNSHKNEILAVRGNCEAEVDQMVLDFPILADYAFLSLDGVRVFATHGHLFHLEHLPPLLPGDILLHGHTHIPACTPFGDRNVYLNPGSAALPKGGFPKSYMVFDSGVFTTKDFEGNLLFTHDAR